MKPNILFMITHDSGRKFPSYGYHVSTPNIDRLVEQSVQFNNYYCTSPQCSPSRGSILTGCYPHNNGLMGLAHLGFSIDEQHTTLPKELKKQGYDTTLIGLSHETIGIAPPIEERCFSSTTKLGYDTYIEIPGERAPLVADAVVAFLKEHKEQDHPFYLNAGFFETHRDFDEYVDLSDPIDQVQVFDFLPDTLAVRKDIANFNGSLKVLDSAVGRILDQLQESGLDQNTIVIFTTDHGVAFPYAKGMLKNAGLETALMIMLPNGSQAGKKKDALLCNIDLLPTILELIDADLSQPIDGKSFADLLVSEQDTGRDFFFTEMTWHDQYRPMRGIRTNEYSYVQNFEDGPEVYISVDAHLSPSGEEVRDACYVPNKPEEFYDLKKDPMEQHNVIDDPAYQTIINQFRLKVANWMSETGDPLLTGPIKGHGSSRWANEIKEGRAYPGRSAYFEKVNTKS